MTAFVTMPSLSGTPNIRSRCTPVRRMGTFGAGTAPAIGAVEIEPSHVTPVLLAGRYLLNAAIASLRNLADSPHRGGERSREGKREDEIKRPAGVREIDPWQMLNHIVSKRQMVSRSYNRAETFIELATVCQSRILSPYLGYRVRNAANDTCARCGNALCDCLDAFWNPRVTEPRATVARSGEITLPTGPGGFVLPFHANLNSAEAQHDHAS